MRRMSKFVAAILAVLSVAGLSPVTASQPDTPAPAQEAMKGEPKGQVQGEAPGDQASTAPVEVMILGLYHFANPGADMVNPQVDDMLAPERQKQIAALVESLADWKPTKITVEDEATAPSFVLESYAKAGELLKTSRDETVQIGYRLALMLGHDAVYGYDERGGEGEPSYFPMDKVRSFANKSGQISIIEGLIAEVQAITARADAERAEQTVARSLYNHNDGAALDALHDKFYYTLIQIGDGDAQPGAELNAYWYMRNAKMFGKVGIIASPGDRVLVIAGSGHASWLRHFAKRTPGFKLVETMPYLERAAETGDATGAETGNATCGP